MMTMVTATAMVVVMVMEMTKERVDVKKSKGLADLAGPFIFLCDPRAILPGLGLISFQCFCISLLPKTRPGFLLLPGWDGDKIYPRDHFQVSAQSHGSP